MGAAMGKTGRVAHNCLFFSIVGLAPGAPGSPFFWANLGITALDSQNFVNSVYGTRSAAVAAGRTIAFHHIQSTL